MPVEFLDISFPYILFPAMFFISRRAYPQVVGDPAMKNHFMWVGVEGCFFLLP